MSEESGGQPAGSGGSSPPNEQSGQDAARPPGQASSRRRGRGRGGRGQNKFKGSNPDLEGHVYDIGPFQKDLSDLFANTTKAIGEYVATNYTGADEYRLGLLELRLPPLTPPADPVDPDNRVEVKKWELQIKRHEEKRWRREDNQGKVFPLILGQCSQTVKDRLEAEATWTQINTTSDVLGLLRLIRKALYTKSTTRKAVHSLIEAEQQFMTFRQEKDMSLSDYLEKFKGVTEIYEHFGGEPGMQKSRVDELLLDPEFVDDDEVASARKAARESYLATFFILRSDPVRYGPLVADLVNDHTRGQDGYPTTMSAAYDMLHNYEHPNKVHNRRHLSRQDGEVAFGQIGDDSGGRGRGGRGRSRGAGGRGGAGRGRGGSEQPSGGADNDNGNNNTESEGYYVYSHHIDSETGRSKVLPSDWLLLDSGSTVNLISSSNLLSELRDVDSPLTVYCNAGARDVYQQGKLGSFPAPVWYNPAGIANILSLFSVSQHYRVTLDTEVDNCFHVHRKDGTTMEFRATGGGLYKYRLRPGETALNVWNFASVLGSKDKVSQQWSMVSTVSKQAAGYTRRAYARAKQARKMQNIVMRPGSRRMSDVVIKHLSNCPVTRGDIQAADDIFGPNLGSLKGKTPRRANPHVAAGVDPVPDNVLDVHRGVTLAIDIIFVNQVPFLLTTSRGLHFGTVEALPSRQVSTIRDKLQTVRRLYEHRGFTLASVLADPEFEPLRPWFPMLNCCGAEEHVPEIERFVRTVKDRVRSTYRMLPFRRIPRTMLIHLVKNAVLWLNAFPHPDGVSDEHSPRYLLTGRELTYDRHVRLEFGSYVQTHEEHTNAMHDRTIGAICLGPTGNHQGGHWFLNLSTGARITRHRWTELPMPSDVIDRVSHIGLEQGMPPTLTFGDRHAREIPETLNDLVDEGDDAVHDADYSDHGSLSDESLDADFDDADALSHDEQSAADSEGVTDDENDENYEDDGAGDEDYDHADHAEAEQEPEEEFDDEESLHSHEFDPLYEQEAEQAADLDLDLIQPPEIQGVGAEIQGVGAEIQEVDEEAQDMGEGEDLPLHDDNENDQDAPETLYDEFAAAEEAGRQAAADGADLPPRTRRTTRNPAFEYVNMMFGDADPEAVFAFMMGEDAEDMLVFVTEQMSAKKGLKRFGSAGADAIMKELEQLIYMKVMQGRKSNQLTREQKKAALRYLMFLKQKRCGRIKGRGCADGRKQRLYKTKEETSSPTVSIEALFLTCVIDAMEGRHVITCDIPGAFTQTDVDELIHIKLEGELAELLVKVEPSYAEFLTYERGKAVIFAELSKALYGTLQASYLFWKDLTRFLVDDLGFVVNPYDWCVANKEIDGKQCTIAWYVDDLKISHESKDVAESVLTKLQERFGKEKPLSVTRGKVHEYLGMRIDYSEEGMVSFSMDDYVKELLDECPSGPCGT